MFRQPVDPPRQLRARVINLLTGIKHTIGPLLRRAGPHPFQRLAQRIGHLHSLARCGKIAPHNGVLSGKGGLFERVFQAFLA